MRNFVMVSDIKNPRGEHQKRVLGAMKTFGSRSASVTSRTVRKVLVDGETYVEILWKTAPGQITDLTVSLIVDAAMKSPPGSLNTCLLDIGGHEYRIPRRLLDRFLSQRLGNDLLPFIRNEYPDFFLEVLDGHTEGTESTVPVWAQWSIGDIGFHRLKETVAQIITDPFDPSVEFTWEEWLDQG